MKKNILLALVFLFALPVLAAAGGGAFPFPVEAKKWLKDIFHSSKDSTQTIVVHAKLQSKGFVGNIDSSDFADTSGVSRKALACTDSAYERFTITRCTTFVTIAETLKVTYLKAKDGRIIVLDTIELRKVVIADTSFIGNVSASDSLKAGTVVKGKKVVMLADSLRGAGLYYERVLICPSVSLPDSSRSKKNPFGVSYDSLGIGNFNYVYVMNADTVGWMGPFDFVVPHNVNGVATKDSILVEACQYKTATADSDSAHGMSIVSFDTSAGAQYSWPTTGDTLAMDSMLITKTAGVATLLKKPFSVQRKFSAVAYNWTANRRVRLFVANRPDKTSYRADSDVQLMFIRIRIPLW